MEEQGLSFMEENELISFPSSKVVDEEEYWTLEQNILNANNTKNPRKRRLIITTMLEEPILIEIRPNLVESLAHPLVNNSTQCNVIENRDHKKNICLKHMNMWNKFYQVIHDVDTSNFCENDWFEKQSKVEDSLIGIEKQGEVEDSLIAIEKQGEVEDSLIGIEKQGRIEDSLISINNQGEAEDSLIGIEKEGKVEDSLNGMEKQINCNELWPKLCTQASDKMIILKQNIKKVMQEKEEEKERYNMLLTKQSDLEKKIKLEKDMQNQDCKKLEAIILELKNQITSQAEEIRRLWIENLANESDELITKSNDIIFEEETPKTKERIIELELQLAKALEQHNIISNDQEIQCEFDKLNNEYSNNQELHHEENITSSLSMDENNNGHIIDYESLVKERNNLKQKLEKVNNDFSRTTRKLHDNVAKRRRLEAESEGEKEQRSNLAAALYELESEVEVTISTIDSLQSTTFESLATLTNDLQSFEEALKKYLISNNFESNFSTEDDDEMIRSLQNDIKQNPIESLEKTSSNIYKGIPDTKSIISKLTEGHENLLVEINRVRKVIHQALKSHECQMHMVRKEMTSKLESIEFEKKTLHWKIKSVEEENESLQEKNSRLQQEVSSLKHAKSTLNLKLKDLEKKMEDFQESLKNLREENRRLLKEAKWKSVGKQGGYQESLVVHEWEKKLQKLEGDYELLRHSKKDLVKEKHRLEDELDRITEKGYKGLGGSEDRNLEEELSNITQERNKLRKIKITLAIENVALKESLAELKIQVDAFENECMALLEWKEKAQKLEEECEDLRDWKKKAEALEVECKDLRNDQMKVEAHKSECQITNSKAKEFEEKHQSLHKNIETIDKECQGTCYIYDNCYEEECKSLRECKANLEKKCERLCQRMCCLEKDQNTFCKLKEKFENSIENNEFYDVDKLKMDILECGFENHIESGSKVEEQNNTLHPLGSTNIEYCNVKEHLEKIASLEQENTKLCQNHQTALDKQWDVLQGDLKAFEIKIEELENECESIRRDHLSSMVENAELIREKERLLAMYNDQKYNYEILETSNECLQKDQEQKEDERMKERNDYQSSIDNLNRQIVELESTFSEKLHKQVSNYELCLGPKTKANGQENITLSRQEYDILLAEKTVMLQERDSAHKKLCSAEVQNLQLRASIECLQKEFPCSNQGHKKNENDAELLLAQDIVNLRSMVSSLEEELGNETCEKNKFLEINKSMRGEINQLNEVLSQCQHENQNLNITLDELKRRSSLEQIHSAASSLKDQLGKASKEKDLIKEQLTKAIKEKEQLTNVANERDKVINSLKEKISKLEKGEEYFLRTQLQDGSNNMVIPSKLNDQSIIVVEESDNIKEVVTLKHNLQLLNNDLIEKTKLWQKERSNFEDKCRRLEVELMNTREAQDMIKKEMEDDLQEAIQTKNNLELIVKNEIKGIYVQVLELKDELFKAKNFFNNKFELFTKEMEYIIIEINLFLQEMMEYKEKKVLEQNEKEDVSNNIVKYNEHTKHSTFSNCPIEDVKQSSLFIPKVLLEQGIQVMLQEDSKFETKKIHHLEKDIAPIMDKDNDELMATTKERDFLLPIVSQLKMEKNAQNYYKDTCSCNGSLIQVPKCEDKLECCFTSKENHNIQISEKKEKSCIEMTTFNQNLCDFEIKMKILNEQLLDLIGEKDQLTFTNQSLLYEQKKLTITIGKLEVEKETMFKKYEQFEQDLNLEISSLKALLAKEEEKFINYKESLHKKLKDHSITIQSLNEQLESLSCEKNCVVHAKEVITLECDSLLDKNSTLEKQLQTIVKIENNNLQKDANNASSLMCKQILFLKDHKNLTVEIISLKKEKEAIENKLDLITKQNCISFNNYRNALDKAQCDLHMKNEQHENLIKENIQLKGDNVILVQTKKYFVHESKNLLIQISLVKKDNAEMKKIFRKEMVQLNSLENELSKAISKKNQIDSNIEDSLIQQSHLLKINKDSQEEHQTKLEREFPMSNQIIKNLVEDKKQITNECKQHDQMQNEYSYLLQLESNMNENFETLFKKFIVLSSEKETFGKDHLANSFEKDQISSCVVTLKAEFGNLNKKTFSLKEYVTTLVEENKKLQIKLQAFSFNNARISMNEEQEICVPNTIEIGKLCNVEPTHKFQREFIKENKHSIRNFLDVHMESPKKELESFEHKDELTIEKDNLITLSKKTKQTHVDIISLEVETLKQKLMLLDKRYNQLVLDRDNVIQENLFMKQTIEPLIREFDNLLTTNIPLKDVKLFANSNVEHQPHAKVDQLMVEKEKTSSKLETFPKDKFNRFAKEIVILVKEFIENTKVREKLVLEVTSLKRECQKLHTILIAAERDKDNLMKSILESRSTIDRVAGEISQLQRKLVETELKLAHLTIERDNANLQIVNLQRLFNNHNRMQHMQESYSLKTFENLEAQNRCLRMEKDVMEDHLKKCSIDLEENYQFEQPMPSLANFKIQKIDSHPLSHPPLYNSSQLFLSRVDSIGRLRPSPPPMLHQQWPI